ncbi:uncharacterized protein [Fopius arisanus]|uniref:Uncharacterized protein n=1 Tax=Fopius arisanus TaxID=64838 RepID=A0A9R1U8P4_9HYME|nr:PREDICTED: uncharacterized protein LOC105271560 [Fopius arisanus]
MENIFNRSYYQLTKRGLQCIGHWPFQSVKKRRFLRCLTYILVTTIVVPKIIKLIESLHDWDIVIECLPMLGCHTMAQAKFFNWIIMEDHMKKLFLTIKRDWESLKLECDFKILHEWSDQARRLNIFYATSLFGVLLVYFSSPSVPKILDLLHPLNETRPRIFLYQTEFFIDQDKYYVYLLIHSYVTVALALAYIVICDNLFTTFVNHACGMFEILK